MHQSSGQPIPDARTIGPSEAAAARRLGGILVQELISQQPPRVEVVDRTVTQLRSIGHAAAGALIECLAAVMDSPQCHDEDEDLASDLQPVFDALAEILPSAPAAVPALLELLQSGETPEWFRAQSAVSLAKSNASAPLVVPFLVELGNEVDTRSELFDAVRYALHKIGPSAVDPLIEILESPRHDSSLETDDASRCFAALILGDFSSPEYPAKKDEVLSIAAKASIRVLIAAVGAGNKKLRLAAVHALGKMGPQAKNAVPVLTAALQDDDRFVREAARNALKIIDVARA